MANIISTPTRALTVIPSDDCNIPTPNLLVEGTVTDDTTSYILIDSNAEFFITNSSGHREYKVNPGDVVYFYATGFASTVIEVSDENTLVLYSGGGVVNGDKYKIYQNSEVTGSANKGCLLSIGRTGTYTLTTSGGDKIEYLVDVNNLPNVTPFQVVKVWATGTTETENILALW